MSVPRLPPPQAPRLLDQVRERVRYLHYSIRTEQAYVDWVRAFVRFHHMRHPREMGQPEVEAFLPWLAADRQVAVCTHRQALSALLFLYQKVFGQDLPWMQSIGRPHRAPRLPMVLSVAEVARVLALLQGEQGLLARLLYGTGMRIAEGLHLRAKDLDFENRTVLVRCGKGRRRKSSDVPAHIAPAGATSACKREVGGKDRALMLPTALVPARHEQLARARALWLADV
jgi:site-specific recombinase XerD